MEVLYFNGVEINTKEKSKFKFMLIPPLILLIMFSIPDYSNFAKISFIDILFVSPVFLAYFFLIYLVFYPIYRRLKEQKYSLIKTRYRIYFSILVISPLLIKNLTYLLLDEQFSYMGFVFSFGMILSILFFFVLIIWRLPGLILGNKIES